MSNYPPGVTGNEPAIAGYGEGHERSLACGKPATLKVPDTDGKVWEVDVDECPWEGPMDCQYGGSRRNPIRYWTCPLCGREHGDDDFLD